VEAKSAAYKKPIAKIVVKAERAKDKSVRWIVPVVVKREAVLALRNATSTRPVGKLAEAQVVKSEPHRGLKAGLPLADCMKIIAAEAQEPVKGEFRAIIEDQAMGMPTDEAVQRMPGRMPVAEASFFAIVITIQSRTGGSLSEALGNLSKVLRERKKMRAKIVAMSSEAKSSAGIIGALPVFVTAAIYITTPDYIGLLFTTSTGNIVLAVSGFWMLMGILVMRKMINFDF
jgi:tight adherence protein B